MRRTKMLLTKCMLRPSWFAEGATASTAPRLSFTTPDSSRPPSSHSSQHLDYTLLFFCTPSALPCFDLLSRSPLFLHSPAVDRIARTAGALPLNADCGLDRCLSSTTPYRPYMDDGQPITSNQGELFLDAHYWDTNGLTKPPKPVRGLCDAEEPT